MTIAFVARVRLAAAMLAALCVLSACRARAEDEFRWRQCNGQSIRVMLSQHPYTASMKTKLQDFERITGIKLAYVMYPEEKYIASLDESLAGPYAPDVYMVGVHHMWRFAPMGRMTPLDPFLDNPSKTRSSFDVQDFFPSVIGSFRWNGKFGSRPGQGDLLAIPLGFETTALTYNREVLSRLRLPPPTSVEELLETGKRLAQFEGEGTYGVAARGMGSWSTLNAGFITMFHNYGAKDMEIENGRLVSKVNSPEAVAATEMWIRMMRECGPPDWRMYNWQRCFEDVGNRRAAMLLDSEVIGYTANVNTDFSQAGKLGVTPPPAPESANPDNFKVNLWSWGLAVNPMSPNRDAAWLFVQYFTSRDYQLYSVLEMNSVNPPRRSVFEHPDFQTKIARMDGYARALTHLVDNAAILFTPNPHFFTIAERWAVMIQDIANGNYKTTQEGLDVLKEWMDEVLSDTPVE